MLSVLELQKKSIYIFMLVACAVQNQEFHLKSSPASNPCCYDKNIEV